MQRVFTLDYSQTFDGARARSASSSGVQLDATKRFSQNWQGLASYVYSKLEGNFDGLYAPFTNIGADPNITAAYDYYDFFTNGSDLSRHHQHAGRCRTTASTSSRPRASTSPPGS